MKDLQEFMDKIVNWRIPGADCIVYHKNNLVFRYQAGYADVKNKIPFAEDNLFNLYSATKVITCTAALQLLEKGSFLLNEPVSDYLPEFKEMYIKKTNGDNVELIKAKESIKIKDLFSMTAGFTNDLQSPSILKVKEQTGGKCPTREIVKAIAKEPLLFEPGTHFNYSLCHDVLGGLIEVVSGKKLSEYMNENIFKPLGMKNTGFYRTAEIEKRMAKQYQFDDEKGVAVEIPLNNVIELGYEYESGGAGLISCADDYIKIALSLTNGGKTQNGDKILSTSSMELMRTNQLDEIELQDFNWPWLKGYGYGLGVRTMIDKAKSGSLSPVGEFGWDGAAGSYVMIDPENQITIFYAQQMLNAQGFYVHPRIRNIVYANLL